MSTSPRNDSHGLAADAGRVGRAEGGQPPHVVGGDLEQLARRGEPGAVSTPSSVPSVVPGQRVPGGLEQDLGLLAQLGRTFLEQDRVDERDTRAGGQELGQQPRRRPEEGDERLDALEGAALGERVELLGQLRPAAQRLAGVLPEPGVDDDLAGGVAGDALDDAGRALVADREAAERLDVVAPELDAHGLVGGGREDVDDATADGELTARLHLRDAAVAERRQALDQLVEPLPPRVEHQGTP